MKKEIKIPEIAENVDTGTLARILVSKGDTVEKDQALVEVETDKAATDIPSPYSGKVEDIKVKEGDEVKVGQTILILEVNEEETTDVKEEKGMEQDEENDSKKDEGKDEEKEKREEKVKEDNHDKEGHTRPAEEEEKNDKDTSVESKEDQKEIENIQGDNLPASPSVRRQARESGVDLLKVKGTGPGGRITSDDVTSYAEKQKEGTDKKEISDKESGLPDFSEFGNISREPMSQIRKIIARRMQESWKEIPHVTQFDESDISRMEEFRQKNKDAFEQNDGKLTITSILLKLSAFALQRFPRFNSSIDSENNEIIFKQYVNIGVAVDTRYGLIVPVIKDVDKKSLEELSVELTQLAEKARNKKISPDDLSGGNFTVSNLGGVGGTAFTPIVYSPQVAILGVSRGIFKRIYRGGRFRKRLIMPLSLSYDHRVIDGAEGARFLRWMCNALEDPFGILK